MVAASLQNRVPEEVLSDVQLGVSELVTNAIRHGGLPADGSIGLRLVIRDDRVRVEVSEAGVGYDPDQLRRPTAGGGWGLAVLRGIADRAGYERNDRNVGWFEIDIG
jgi:anti-sigma regulatory factor (Ser/Thr protein kinase)